MESARSPRRAARYAVVAAVVLGIVAAVTIPAVAATTVCGKFDVVSIANGAYHYQQDEWNSSATQCASVNTTSPAFSLTTANFNLATNGPPATYPSLYKGCHWGSCTSGSGMPKQVSALSSVKSSWSTTQPGSGAYDVAYDIWTNQTATTSGQPNGSEVMIWLNSRGGVQPAGSKVATVSLAGATWDVWYSRASTWNIISYKRTSGTTSVSNLDVKAFISDSVKRGWTKTSWYLIAGEAGFEVWQGGQGLATGSFSFSVS